MALAYPFSKKYFELNTVLVQHLHLTIGLCVQTLLHGIRMLNIPISCCAEYCKASISTGKKHTITAKIRNDYED